VTLTALPHEVGGKVWLRFDWYFFDQDAGSPDATAWYDCTENDCQDTQTNFYPLGNFSYRVNVSKWNVVGPVEPWAVGHANVFVAGTSLARQAQGMIGCGLAPCICLPPTTTFVYRVGTGLAARVTLFSPHAGPRPR